MYRTRTNKYGARKQSYNGYQYDSKHEAGVAQELDLRLSAKDILDWERQYKVVMKIYNEVGKHVHSVSHKVDFRVHELDGSFTLLEAKGMETTDYRFRRKLLEKIWLVDNPDHVYEVIYCGRRRPVARNG